MGPQAILAILSTIQLFLDNALVKRMLKNIAAKTTNDIDNWVLDVIYGAAQCGESKEATKQKLDAVQKKYDELQPEEKTRIKENSNGNSNVPPTIAEFIKGVE